MKNILFLLIFIVISEKFGLLWRSEINHFSRPIFSFWGRERLFSWRRLCKFQSIFAFLYFVFLFPYKPDLGRKISFLDSSLKPVGQIVGGFSTSPMKIRRTIGKQYKRKGKEKNYAKSSTQNLTFSIDFPFLHLREILNTFE